MPNLFLVYDRTSKEGVVFENAGDALYAETGDNSESSFPGTSSLADEFRDLYGETGDIVCIEISLSDDAVNGDDEDE